MDLLEVSHVWRSYARPGGAGGVPVLVDASLSLPAGGSLAVVGPSGSGKSTLLNIIAGLDRPDAGQVRLDGRELPYGDADALAELRRRQIGLVFQLHHLLPQCTVLENVLVPTLLDGPAQRRDAIERALGLLDRVGLADRRHHRPAELSGGERQRVAVVRALVNRPRLLLADEPTGSLDRAAAEELAELLLELHRRDGLSLLVVTHWAELAARLDRTYVLRDGALVEGAA